MFDKIRRKASRAIKNVVSDAAEDTAERETRKVVSKAERDAQESSDRAAAEQYGGMKVSKKITGSMITDFDKFQKSWEKSASDPAQSVFHLLIAAYNYCLDPEIGDPMATVVLSKKHNQKDASTPTGLKLGKTNRYLFRHMAEDINIVKSYLGANYKADYKFNEKKLTMSLLTFDSDGKYGKVVIQSGGKDFPTPVKVGKNKNGQWKILEFSSVATGCRKPASEEDDF